MLVTGDIWDPGTLVAVKPANVAGILGAKAGRITA